MNIERGPRKQRGFVIIDNALAQNNALSFGARGLAEYLLSLPPGAKVDIRSLAEDNPEGRQAIAGYMNELEASRYLVRTRRQGARGRFETSCTMHDEPQDPASLPESLPKPWSKAKDRQGARLSIVQDQQADATFSQVGPNPASPDFGGPDFGGPGPGRPDVGETGANPYGVKGPGERTSSSPAREDSAALPAEPMVGGGGGGDAPQQQEEHPRAAAFVDSLPYRGKLPGPRQLEHLIGRVSEALAAGWPEWKLRQQLVSETDSAKSLSAVYRHRLAPENLPMAPVMSEAADSVPEQRPGPVSRPKCPECHRPLMNATESKLCRDCREDVTA
jgi:hypothetical protein